VPELFVPPSWNPVGKTPGRIIRFTKGTGVFNRSAFGKNQPETNGLGNERMNSDIPWIIRCGSHNQLYVFVRII